MERYSFSGKGNILIKAGVAGKYGEKTYAANEPIAFFTEVFVNLNFQFLEKTPRVAIDNLAVAAKSSLSYVQVTNIKVSESLQSLLYKKKTQQTKSRTLVKNFISEGTTIFLPIGSEETITNNIFIYSSLNKDRVTEFILENSTGEITNLPYADTQYTIFYEISETAVSTYSLEAPNFPHIALEIQVDGNLNGKTGQAVIHLDKVSLLTRPSLDMNSETPFIDDLEFAVLAGSSAEVNYYG